jgi:phosphoribosylanthranilate isomerase
MFSIPVIKAISVHSANDMIVARQYYGIADRLLFDAKAPKGSQLPGGNGISFDWKLLHDIDPDIDWMLSGGLDRDNIVEALAISGAISVDVSSGVESAPGIKDVEKISAFIKTVRNNGNGRKVAGS